MARTLGVTPLAVGLTVVAYGTSAPEMVASVVAAAYRHPDITVGNVVGSNIANIGLILGVTALLSPFAVPSRLIRREVIFMLTVTTLFGAMAWRGVFSRGEGIFLLAALAAFNVLSLWWARREPRSMQEEFCAYEEETVGAMSTSLSGDIALVAFGLGMLFAGSHFLVTGSIDIARRAGVSETAIGLTLVALGTSLPELATSIVAVLRRESAVCVGNLVGSNLFNILGAIGLSAAVRPFPVDPTLMGFEFPALFLFTAAMAFVLLTGRGVRRGEGAALLAGYALFMALLSLRFLS
jgi:cation:H+ antiporter